MLDSTETLLFSGSNHLAVAQKAGGRVAVESVDAEDVGHLVKRLRSRRPTPNEIDKVISEKLSTG